MHHAAAPLLSHLLMTEQNPKMSGRFPCPKCRQPGTKVRITGEGPDGVIARKRWCPHCEHNFFTAQEPEWVVRKEDVRWNVFHKPYLVTQPDTNGQPHAHD